MSMAETPLKICVVGPCRSGKTLLTKIIGQQPIVWTEHLYDPTPSLRIQEACVFVDMEKIQLEFWDCSGNVDCRKYWNVMSQNMDGLLLVCDPLQVDESVLEKFYKAFSQRNNLTHEQCLLMAIRLQSPVTRADVTFKHPKLTQLPQITVDLSNSDVDRISKILMKSLRPFLKACLTKRE